LCLPSYNPSYKFNSFLQNYPARELLFVYAAAKIADFCRGDLKTQLESGPRVLWLLNKSVPDMFLFYPMELYNFQISVAIASFKRPFDSIIPDTNIIRTN